MRAKRIDSIILYIKKKKTVTIEQLCNEFGVSVNTIRRDLVEILETGDFKKIYGGITCSTENSLKPFDERYIKNQALKQKIAQKSASFVSDGDIIFIDSGTTTYHMIEYLKDKKDITILTHNLEALTRAVPYPNLHMVVLPGDLNHKTLSFTGLNTANYLSNYNISKSFIATSGLSVDRGITNSSPQEYEIKVTALSRSQENYILADHTKFNNVSLLTYNNFENIHAIVTDQIPEEEFRRFLSSKNIDIVIC